MEGEVLVICPTRGGSFQAGLAGEDTPGMHFPPATTVPTMFNKIPSLIPDSTRVVLVIPVPNSEEEVAHHVEVAFSIPIPSLLISTTPQMACYASGRTSAILLDFTTKSSVILYIVLEGTLLYDLSFSVSFQKDWDQMSEEELATQLHQLILPACNEIRKRSVEIPMIFGCLGELQQSIVFFGIEASEFQKVKACHDSVLQSLARDLGKCKIIIPPESTYSAWIGASLLGSLESTHLSFVTREKFLSLDRKAIGLSFMGAMLINVTSRVEEYLNWKSTSPELAELRKEYDKNMAKLFPELNLIK